MFQFAWANLKDLLLIEVQSGFFFLTHCRPTQKNSSMELAVI